ncbi:MAG: D-2-hydroxyacid dehydrogenase [Oscillospiraceae bacterium]|nr:D-2-hydroxyacid dehydrogenase [Oscillospiraceae bacterium]
MKIVILDGHALNPGDLCWDFLNQYGDVDYYDRTDSTEDVVSRMQDAEIVLLNKVKITESILAQCPSVKLICVLATGYDVVDTKAATRHGVTVCNVPAYGTNAVAQYTFALLLELCHQVGAHSMSVFRGDWAKSKDFCYWLTTQRELAGKTIGIIGFGKIGKKVAEIATAFGMRILVFSRTVYPGFESVCQYVSLEELLTQSDVISLHSPLTSQTERIINAETLSKMKSSALLINTARGGLVDEYALSAALATGKIAGYAGDVVTVEPILPENPLLNAPNCILTPHMAWAPTESRQRILNTVAENIEGFLVGSPNNVVNS